MTIHVLNKPENFEVDEDSFKIVFYSVAHRTSK